MKYKYLNLLIIMMIFLTIILKLINSSYFLIYNSFLEYIAIILSFSASIYFSIKLKFIQINIFKIIRSLLQSTKKDIQALFVSLGAKIGVGSIAGISLAIYLGGPGVIFWIWIISILSSILTYCETYLGVKYNIRNRCGPFYYIRDGLNNNMLAIIYVILFIFVYVIGFVGIQSNTIIKSINYVFDVNYYYLTIILAIIVGIIIFNKLNSVIDFISKLVPVMCIIYIVLSLTIIIKNDYDIIKIFYSIIREGLKLKPTIFSIIILGLKRGVFATESGLGTSSIASSISNVRGSNQGIFQVIGTHFTSLIIVTITAILVIGSNYNYIGNINGIEIVMNIFNSTFNFMGSMGLILIIILFALSSIISAYYYGIKAIEFIKGNLKKIDYLLIKVMIIWLVFLGGIVNSTVIWSLVDILIILLLIINICAIIKLRREIK